MQNTLAQVKVHFTKWIIVPVLSAGLACLVTGVWLMLLEGSPNQQIFLGAIITLSGLLTLRTPVFALEAESIALYRPIGLVSKRFPFRSRSEIRINDNKLFVGSARVPVKRWYLNRSQWRLFEQCIAR